MKIGSPGGKATAIKLRNEALKRYYDNPSYCKECGKVLAVKDGQKVRDTRKKSFCNQSCSAKYNNRNVDRRKGTCQQCGTRISSQRIYCKACFSVHDFTRITDLTKRELFKSAKNYTSARSQIGRHARKIYDMSNKTKECVYCGYDKYVEICHIKDVCSFEDHICIGQINDISNLICLCRNHHWEFDNDLLIMRDGEMVSR